MRITEEDIFLFSLFPEELDTAKREYIEQNSDQFKSQIEFCRMFKEPGSKKIEQIVDRKYSNSTANVVHLFPLRVVLPFEHGGLSLAACSGKDDKSQTIVNTYTDGESQYILKIIRIKDENKVYLFKSDNTLIYNFKLKLHPSGEVLEVNNHGSIRIPDSVTEISEIEVILPDTRILPDKP